MFNTYGWINNITLSNIADAIRQVNGTTNTYKPSEMSTAISDIQISIISDDSAKQWMESTLNEYRSQTIESIPDECFGGEYINTYSPVTIVELGSATSIGKYAFSRTKIATLIIRTNLICTLGNGALSNTPISEGTGYIYVPSSLIEAYKVATNWVNYAAQFRAIEDYPDVCG